jgi:hypothetical protein
MDLIKRAGPMVAISVMTPELLGLQKVQDNHTISAIGWAFWRWELLARIQQFFH